MKLRVAFLLALSFLACGASMLVGLDMPRPRLQTISHDIAGNVGLTVQPCGDPVEGPPSFPH